MLLIRGVRGGCIVLKNENEWALREILDPGIVLQAHISGEILPP